MQNQQLKTVAIGTLLILTTLFLIKFFDLSYPLSITTTTRSSELSVIGEGKVDVVPDTAVISAGITVSSAQTAEQAKEQMAKVNNAILDGVKSLGVKKEDVTTSNFSIYPQENQIQPLMYPPNPAGGTGQGITGYRGNATITIKVHKTDLASQVVEKITAAGATNISGPSFTIESPEKFREQARQKAIENAKEQATKLSKELGIRLGGVTNIIESNSPTYDSYGRGGLMMSAESKASVPPVFEGGTQTVTSTVTLFFERK